MHIPFYSEGDLPIIDELDFVLSLRQTSVVSVLNIEALFQ